jgi:hypothetical protein
MVQTVAAIPEVSTKVMYVQIVLRQKTERKNFCEMICVLGR